MGTQIKDNPRNIANPEPNVAPLASPNVKLSARGLFKTVETSDLLVLILLLLIRPQ